MAIEGALVGAGVGTALRGAEVAAAVPSVANVGAEVTRGAVLADTLASSMPAGEHATVGTLVGAEMPEIDTVTPISPSVESSVPDITSPVLVEGGASAIPLEAKTTSLAGDGGEPPRVETPATSADGSGGEPPKAEGSSIAADGEGNRLTGAAENTDATPATTETVSPDAETPGGPATSDKPIMVDGVARDPHDVQPVIGSNGELTYQLTPGAQAREASGGVSSVESGSPTTAPEAAAPESASETSKTPAAESKLSDTDKARYAELSGKPATELTATELKERNDLKKKHETEKTAEKNEGARYDNVRKKLEAGEDVADEDIAFAEQFEQKRADGADEQSKEAVAAADELKDLGHDAMTKLANGDDGAQEAMDKFKQKYSEANPTKTPESNFSDLVKKALSKDRKAGTDKESREIQEMRKRLGEVIQLERDLMVVSQRLDALTKQYEETKNELKSLGGPSFRMDKDQQRRMERYKLMNHLITLQSEGQKTMLSKYEINAKYAKTKAYLDRKLGVKGMVGLVVDYASVGLHSANLGAHRNADWLKSDAMGLAA